ncbi:MAG: Tetratricopeptide (TPR) repeat [Verrucomicrobia bacterium]|nr:MAG: Tetratricopeptide (TPR) repeat [Verrucomicrobiota bacterium]
MPFRIRFLGFMACLVSALVLALAGHAQHFETSMQSQRQFDEHYLPRLTLVLDEGHYDMIVEAAGQALTRSASPWKWQILRLRGLEALGRWDQVREELPGLVKLYGNEVVFLAEAHRLHVAMGQPDEAGNVLRLANAQAQSLPLKSRGAAELVALGRIAAALGADPERILKQFYGAAKSKDPKSVEPFLAAGELALAKSDYARAAQEFRGGLQLSPRDPNLRFGLARAFWPGDREEAVANAQRVLEVNPAHAGALLLQVEQMLDSERYAEAEPLLQRVVERNAAHPVAWAMRALVALLRDNDEDLAGQAVEKALELWARNPEVPHVVGRGLSRHYRFAEGAAEQRKALAWDPGYLAARVQLAADLLRLGGEEEAWALSAEVARADPYNVLAFNYLKLKDQLAAYETRRTPHFTLRMRPDEMKIYGDRVESLLEEGRTRFLNKYAVDLSRPTLVEIFAEQQDFAIRTFGELGGGGYLGVCFGTVITVNSPGSHASGTTNWEATLWHEFCHVVTLTATRNRMPRWLSEGISVHEERLRDPAWGQPMTPQWRERILRIDGLTPIADLSSAFRGAEKPEDLMFAYFQSSMVVDFLVATFGEARFRSLLGNLAKGEGINEALAAVYEPIESLETKFQTHARAQAQAYGGGVDWTRPEDLPASADPLAAHPKNYWLRQSQTLELLGESRWKEALRSAEAQILLFPGYTGDHNGHELAARAARALGDDGAEANALRAWTRQSAAASAACLRLIELDQKAGNTEGMRVAARQQLAINPFLQPAHYALGCAAQAAGENAMAVESFQKLLLLKPDNAAEIHYRLGQVLAPSDVEGARRHVLEALLEAPRYLEAHRLLVELKARKSS